MRGVINRQNFRPPSRISTPTGIPFPPTDRMGTMPFAARGKIRFFVDWVAGEPSNRTPALFSPYSAAFPGPVERFPVSGWTSGVERRVGWMVRTQ
jgi:hypothetical protein